MRYILTGAQGTGKSTLLHHFDNDMKVITEVVRNLAKSENINVNESGDMNGQDRIFNTYYDILSQKDKTFISDRGLTDVIAYTRYNMSDKIVEEEKFLENQLDRFIKFSEENDDIVYFYVPIEFAVENDGFRSTNEEFRNCIDMNIRELFAWAQIVGLNLTVYTIKGPVEERVETMREIMKQYGDLNYE